MPTDRRNITPPAGRPGTWLIKIRLQAENQVVHLASGSAQRRRVYRHGYALVAHEVMDERAGDVEALLLTSLSVHLQLELEGIQAVVIGFKFRRLVVDNGQPRIAPGVMEDDVRPAGDQRIGSAQLERSLDCPEGLELVCVRIYEAFDVPSGTSLQLAMGRLSLDPPIPSGPEPRMTS